MQFQWQQLTFGVITVGRPLLRKCECIMKVLCIDLVLSGWVKKKKKKAVPSHITLLSLFYIRKVIPKFPKIPNMSRFDGNPKQIVNLVAITQTRRAMLCFQTFHRLYIVYIILKRNVHSVINKTAIPSITCWFISWYRDQIVLVRFHWPDWGKSTFMYIHAFKPFIRKRTLHLLHPHTYSRFI